MSAQTTTTTAAHQPTQYIYIPNLVGKQMLRVPCDDPTPSSMPPPAKSTSAAPQPISRTSSWGSVSEAE